MQFQTLTGASADPFLALLLNTVRTQIERNRGVPNDLDAGTELLAQGIVDSQELLDIILQVEQISGRDFDIERLDIEQGLTVARLAEAFVPIER